MNFLEKNEIQARFFKLSIKNERSFIINIFENMFKYDENTESKAFEKV